MRLQLPDYPRAVWLLAVGMTIHVTGASFLWPLNTIYVHEVLGRSLAMAGFVLMLQSAAGMVGSLIGGHLFDLWGGRRTLLLGILMAASAVTALAFTRAWAGYVALMVWLGFSTSLIFPSMYAFASSVWPEGGRRAFNVIYVAQNVGVAIGSSLGGFVAQVGFKFSFLANAAALLIFLVIVLVGYRGRAWQVVKLLREAPEPQRFRRLSQAEKALLLLAAGLFLAWVPYVQWQTTTATYMQEMGIPLPRYSLLWTVNGGLILLGQPLIAWITARLPVIQQQILLGGAIFIAAYVLLIGTTVYAGYLAAMTLTTLGEMLVWPGVPALANQLAQAGRRGFYQGAIGSAATMGRMVGPLLGGILFDQVSRPTLYAIMAGLFAASWLVFANYDRIAERRRAAAK